MGIFASFLGTLATKSLKQLRNKIVDGDGDGMAKAGEKAHSLPLLRSSLTYGSYMALSSNIRYQMVAGVFEQRFLEPLVKNSTALGLR